MGYLAKYKKGDFKRVTWEEYGRTLDKLYKKIDKYLKRNKIKIDAVVPILRGGAFPGAYLAFKLNLLKILPVQYKYIFKGKDIELRKMFGFSKSYLGKIKKPIFLLVENNHCFGLTASTAVKDLKKQFPNCKVVYTVDHVDYSYKKIEGVDKTFYGRLTNETRALNNKECRKKGIKNISYLFPWETLDEEWTTVQGKQFKYRDLNNTIKISKMKVSIKDS